MEPKWEGDHGPSEKRLVLAMLLATTAPAFAQSRVLVFNTDASDPAPKAAFDQLIAISRPSTRRSTCR